MISSKIQNDQSGGENLRDFVDWSDDGGQEFIRHCAHVFDGGFQTVANFFMAHSLFWRNIIRQLAAQSRIVYRRLSWIISCQIVHKKSMSIYVFEMKRMTCCAKSHMCTLFWTESGKGCVVFITRLPVFTTETTRGAERAFIHTVKTLHLRNYYETN